MIYYWAALSPPAFTWMLEFFCMIMMYNEIQPWIDDYQVFVWVLVGLHHSFVILRTWILKVFNKNTISALVYLSRLVYFSSHVWFSCCRKHFCSSSPTNMLWERNLFQTKQPARTVLCFLTPRLNPNVRTSVHLQSLQALFWEVLKAVQIHYLSSLQADFLQTFRQSAWGADFTRLQTFN